jgi:L-ascorbate metabolism protein UlaG (beta-lactamase superfamily)
MITIQWLGTAGFRIQTEGRSFLFDPNVRGGNWDHPPTPEELGLTEARPDVVLISHGHLDHAGDVPQILEACGAEVVCNDTVSQRLLHRGIPRERVIPVEAGTRYFHRDYRLEVFPARHAPLDLGATLRLVLRAPSRAMNTFARVRAHPAGSTLSYRLAFFSGCRIQHFGSAGTTDQELTEMSEAGSLDVLLLPLQRHKAWMERIVAHVEALRPRILIPHHFDDCMPPFTEAMDIGPAVKDLGKLFPGVRVVRLHENETFQLTTW